MPMINPETFTPAQRRVDPNSWEYTLLYGPAVRLNQLLGHPSSFFADFVSDYKYGVVPTPANGTIAAPQTRPQMTEPGAWTPEQAGAEGLKQQTAETQQRILDAEANGSYFPDRYTIPDPPSFNNDGIMIAALVCSVAALWSLRR